MKKQKCEECEGKFVRKKVEFIMYGINLGNFPADVCTKCGEELFDEKTSEEIDKVAKEKGLWGLARKVKIVKIGNSLAVRIPKVLSDFLGLKEGKEALIRPDKDKIIIES